MNGIIIINKEENYTSRDIVNIVGKHFKTKKIGHTGTLDPLATGVLVLCINEATKLVEILTSDEKEYIAEVTLGIKTDTLDITGNVLEEQNAHISKEDILESLNSLTGIYSQQVPIYSAVKVNGKKLYQYARENKEIELPKREVNIKELHLIDEIEYVNNKTIFKIKCTVSKGTYIRSLVSDIAFKLNTIGVMSKLKRTKQGIFKIEDAYTLEDIENNNYKIIELNETLFNYKKVIVDNALESKIRNGVLIPNIYGEDIILFLNQNKELISLYKKYDKDSSLLKPWKMFKGGNI